MARRAVFNMRDERPVWAPPAWVMERLRARLPAEWELVEVQAPVSGRGDGGGVSAEALAAVRGAEIYFGLGLPHDLLLALLTERGVLRWIHTGAAGVASLLHDELRQSDVVLTNSAGIHAEPMADTVLAMILHFARGLDYVVRSQQRGEWEHTVFEDPASGVRELSGAVVGVIGFGGIGQAVAKRARALGMDVVALRRSGEAISGVEILAGDGALHELIARSDYVVLTVPSTADTRGMLGADEFARMRRDAVLINVARGDVIDTAALVDALSARRLRGAGLDVFETEPLPPQHPLWRLDNVLITPHVSATTPRYWEREAELMLDNLQRYLGGQSMRNVVDTALGY